VLPEEQPHLLPLLLLLPLYSLLLLLLLLFPLHTLLLLPWLHYDVRLLSVLPISTPSKSKHSTGSNQQRKKGEWNVEKRMKYVDTDRQGGGKR